MTTTFPRFADLPTELRLQIWRHALEAPRVIDVQRVFAGHGSPYFRGASSKGGPWSANSPPRPSSSPLSPLPPLLPSPRWTIDGDDGCLKHAPALCFANRESRATARGYQGWARIAVDDEADDDDGNDNDNGSGCSRRSSSTCSQQRRWVFALGPGDVLALPARLVLCTFPKLRIHCLGQGGYDGAAMKKPPADYSGGGVRRVLIQAPLDALYDIVGPGGPWHPSGWPHTSAMRRALARAAFDRLHSVLGADLQIVYCLPDDGGWAAPSAASLPPASSSASASVWEGEPLLSRMVTLYDRAVNGEPSGGGQKGNLAKECIL